jgi:CheY-like chemotaxis protein
VEAWKLADKPVAPIVPKNEALASRPSSLSTEPAANQEKVNILVVDDLPEKVLVLRSVLDDLGENVIAAYSGRDALRLALEHDYAVILLDINMPDIDGFETAALIRQRKKSAHTPIIFVTSFADELHAARGYSLGAVDFILAPVVPEILRSKVKVFVDLFRMTEQVRHQAEERVALAREQAARAAAEEATRRSAFLADASRILASSLDFGATMRSLARLPVPFIADLAAATHVDMRGRVGRTELAWSLPTGDVETATLAGAEQLPTELLAGIERALASGEAGNLAELDVQPPDPACNGSTPPAFRIQSAVIFPLMAYGRTLGVLTLASGPSHGSYTPADLALCHDLASRAAIAADNAGLYQSIQEADRRKNEFLAMLAHELRTPLAPIRNAVQLMRKAGPHEPQVTQARDMIDRQAAHMARLIDDLLDMSRISQGKILLRKEPLDLTKLVRATAEDYRVSLEKAGLALEVEIPSEPLMLEGDPTRLGQVLGNILHNAGKFTDAGGRVTIRLGRETDGKTARLSVRDSGIGIEPEMLVRVFETFSQADRSLDRSRGGLGLGLSLVKGLVEQHGGAVEAFSAGLGRGTEVVVHLPLDDRLTPTRAAACPNNCTGAAHRVLVIEDHVDTAESMAVLLRLSGHQVELAKNGAIGIEAAHRFRPDIVLCDIGIPGGMDGYAVARAFRQDPELASTYLVAITGYGQEEDRRRSREAGFNVHLTKPVDFDDLQRQLATVPART